MRKEENRVEIPYNWMIRTSINIALLCGSIVLIAKGIYESDLILVTIGGFFAGTYNYMIEKKNDYENN